MPTIKNIIIFVAIGGVIAFAYFYFFRPSQDKAATLVSSGAPAASSSTASVNSAETETVARNFINLLLSVKSIKLNDAIFSDEAFKSLQDSSITLVPDGKEGRPNPFAPIGVDIGEVKVSELDAENEVKAGP